MCYIGPFGKISDYSFQGMVKATCRFSRECKQTVKCDFLLFQVYVRYFVLVTGNMAAEFAIAKKVGKGQNAMSLKEIVALPTVPVMENASEDSASASLDGKVII